MAWPKSLNAAGIIEKLKQKIASLQQQWRRTRREIERLRQENEQLRQERERLREENERLKRQLEEAQRASKRQRLGGVLQVSPSGTAITKESSRGTGCGQPRDG